ncbi:ATP-binding protein [Agrobacterium vitis]|uniref:ATP-binding protein n=1 Tax=Agrobacterium vitis TaxID=373 RepID=A0AAE2R951_AGRVI|nr:ATP-binding protein [Agrobacterium vitis]MBF2713204.1 ATP-binding protein [Agrobacterium vitis]
MSFPIIPQNLSITAMRSSGYRDSAHALAELIDNAIQAGQEHGGTTQVELICVDEAPSSTVRKRISRIAVYDNAVGMDPAALRKALQFGNGSRLDPKNQKGIGKFGMGLPNSSISQCKRVDVWSWQGGNVFHTYLDIDTIQNGNLTEVPDPTVSAIPAEWLKLIAGEIAPHGTLVVWSNLDRISWKQSSTLLRNTEFIAGRVYRRFINKKSVRIRLAAYELAAGTYNSTYESFVRPNDPLYLMAGTNTPAPFDQLAAFELFGEPVSLTVGYNGQEHDVTIRASISKKETRREGGNRPIGRHAKKNQGISVVRADRELELNRSFENSYDPRERWWGIEVEFEPALDDVFGVTNNKQAATGFYLMDLGDDAAAEGMSESEYRDMLKADRDPRLPMYRISREIDKLLDAMRARIAKMKEGERTAKRQETDANKAEKAATEAVNRRRERIGDTGRSDQGEKLSPEARAQALMMEIVNDGVEDKVAQQIAIDYVAKKIKFRFRHADVSGQTIFDTSTVGGVILITLNTRHPVHEKLFEVLRDEEAVSNSYAKEVLSLIAAWARLEDEAQTDKMRIAIEDMRLQWGRMAMDFFELEED